jgi:hypothetical protein
MQILQIQHDSGTASNGSKVDWFAEERIACLVEGRAPSFQRKIRKRITAESANKSLYHYGW